MIPALADAMVDEANVAFRFNTAIFQVMDSIMNGNTEGGNYIYNHKSIHTP